MKHRTILGSQKGRWLILAALVALLGALLLATQPVFAQTAPPDAPTGLRAVVVNGTTVELYWTAPTNDGGAEITAYEIQQSTDGRTGWTASTATGLLTGEDAGNTPDEKTYYEIDGLTESTTGTTMHFRVLAINTSGGGAPSNVVKAITTPSAGHPAKPDDFVVEANGSAEINLAWTAPTGAGTGGADIAGYMIEYAEMAGTGDAADAPVGALPWKELKTTTNDDTKYSNTGLSPVTKRWYRVSAINADDERGPVSDTAAATTTAVGVPAAPTGLKALVVADDNIELYWTAPTNTGGGPLTVYRIETLGDANAWATLGEPATDENDDTYRVDTTTLADGTKRSYRVSAMNSIGKGLVSMTVTVEEPGAAHPMAPEDLTAVAGGSTIISLIWAAPSSTGASPVTGYVVEYAEKAGDGDAADAPVGALPWKELTTTSSNTASHTGLKPETKRWYRVSAINSKGRSLASNVASATTAMKGPFSVEGSNAVSLAENSVNDLATYRVVGVDADASVRWTLEGDDAGDFMLDGSGMSRMLKFRSSPNYEMPMDADSNNTYMVTVKASHGSGADMVMDIKDVTVSVDNVEEMGMVTLMPVAPVVGIAVTATLTDPDIVTDGSTTWQWSKSMTMDGTFMNISEATMMAYTPVEADDGYYLMAKATYTDGYDSGNEEMATTTSAVVSNTAPMFADNTTTRTIAENTAAGTNIGAPVTAMDPDGDTLTYSLRGTDAASFDIEMSTGQLMTKAALDYETKTSYMVTVTATDPDDESDSINVTIDIINEVENAVEQYDSDKDGEIDASELFDAVDDYFAGRLTTGKLFDVIDAFFASNG